MLSNLKAFIRHGKQANDIRKKPISNPINFREDEGTTATTDVHATGDIDYIDYDEAIQLPIEEEPVKYDQYQEVVNIVHEERIQREKQVKYPNLENYEVLEKMGEGAFSIVYKALHLPTKEFVAIKILRKFQMDQAQKSAVLKEVAIMRQLNHKNIVLFIEFVDSEPYYYIVQELAAGGEIFSSIVKYTYFSEDLTRHVITQVADALRYLHEEVGIVHRDIKPENLLFMPIEVVPSLNPVSKLRKSDDPQTKQDEGEFVNGVGGGGIGLVKVADFGLSKQIWEDNTKTPCGTVGYTAPEIVRDERYSKEVDMWAMGCVLYTLLCGFPPFYDERIETLTEKVARGEYTFLSPWWDEISDEAKHCVQKLLTVNPLKRYTIDDLLNDPWMTKQVKKQEKRTAPQAPSSNRIHPIQKYSKKYTDGMYSPAATALRDVFDVSAAVHRRGEEAALQQKFDRPIVEEEDEDEYATFNVREAGIASPRFNEDLFNLNIGGASILERRRNKEEIHV